MFKKKLTNFKVIQKMDIKGQDYFIIFDNDNQGGKNAYFCWTESIKTGKEDLVKNWQNWKEIEIEYQENEKGNKVIGIWSNTNDFDFLI